MSDKPAVKIAIAHDYITQRGGAERVVLALSRTFPDAPIYTTLYEPGTTFPEFQGKNIITSPLNKVGFLRKNHRAALPFLAWASNRVKIDADVVVASSSGWAHGFPTNGKKFVYCHSPARWLYLSDNYLGKETKKSPVGLLLEGLKPLLLRWDKRAAATGDVYVANANVIKQRIKDAYGFDVDVIPPPFGVDTTGDRSPIADIAEWEGQRYLLLVSRLLPYKNVDKAIDAMRGRPEKLLVVGAGPMGEQLRRTKPENVHIASGISDEELRWAYANCTGLIAPSYEDFGLTPLEGGAFGKPVAAFHSGGYLDTVVDGLNGVFFEQPTPELIAQGIDELTSRTWDTDAIKAHADTFSEAHFAARVRAEVEKLLA